MTSPPHHDTAPATGSRGGSPAVRRRLSAGERRDQVVRAAIEAFAEGGYTGTTTDQVARRAGVSQPYVVRMFGSKHALFLAAFTQATDALVTAFTQAANDGGGREQASRAYTALVADRNVLLVMLHGFAAGSDAEIGPHVRRSFAEVVHASKDAIGAAGDELRDFIAHGMLINTLIALQVPQHLDEDPLFRDLAECTFGDTLDIAVGAPEQRGPSTA